MDYPEALKEVQAKKPKENFLVVTVAYDNKLILPHKDGLALVAALATAEKLQDGYSEKGGICALDRDCVRFTTMSRDEYEERKVATLLAISWDAVKQSQLQPG